MTGEIAYNLAVNEKSENSASCGLSVEEADLGKY
jgi:hypothetical protein